MPAAEVGGEELGAGEGRLLGGEEPVERDLGEFGRTSVDGGEQLLGGDSGLVSRAQLQERRALINRRMRERSGS